MFPEITPYESDHLNVDATHRIYYEVCGNPTGLPVLFVHGGPGGGCDTDHRRFFDPEHYRIILVDQRGCGRSTPHASLIDNSTPHLIDDFEVIRTHLNIKQWVLFGGSWGSTLSLAYAIAHPERILGLILRGIFLARTHEINWIMQHGASMMAPEAWNRFISLLNEDEQEDILSAYYQRLTNDDLSIQQTAALHLARWEAEISTLKPDAALIKHFTEPDFSLALARIEIHYLYHQCFLNSNTLLEHIDTLKDLPVHIVQGQYDLICPPNSAWTLAQALPQATLTFTQAGHAASEPETQAALIEATQQFLKTHG
jgi:proline iminopeptidase